MWISKFFARRLKYIQNRKWKILIISSKLTEYDDTEDVYGHSVDDDAPISPTDANQWLYDRERSHQSMASFMANHVDIEEEDEEQGDSHRRNSEVS